MFKFYRCLAETHVYTPAKYDIILYSITKVSGKRAQLFVQMLEKPKRTSSVCYRGQAPQGPGKPTPINNAIKIQFRSFLASDIP